MPGFDFKKEYPEFYLPKKELHIIDIPAANYAAVFGYGDPNAQDGDYGRSIELLYAVIFTIKMSRLGNWQPDGYFDFVAPPLEGLWWTGDFNTPDLSRKDHLSWCSMMRLPDLVTPDVLDWAVNEAAAKKRLGPSRVQFFPYLDGLCVQCMHIGPYDDEPKTISEMERYAASMGYWVECKSSRCHHEIHLSDPRRCRPVRLKTVIRQPVRQTRQVKCR